ncbi:integral membrane protein MviN [Serratia fonticola]|uniref:Integral membrane protein MviN n=1 Tax=Serratia fonticola TaxID=47917 RepID=A0A4U9TD03_SERFO|nr:integral membrane protein MviN [Serratia fonticola]
MNLIFIGPLKHAGLSLSIGLGACLNASLLYWQLRKQDIFQPQPGWAMFLFKLVVAVLVMAAVLLGVMWLMPEWDQGNYAGSLTASVGRGGCGDCCLLRGVGDPWFPP